MGWGDWQSDLRDASVLVRTELRARLRYTRGETRQLLGVVAVLFGFGVVLPLMGAGQALSFGRTLAGGTVPAGRAGAVFGGIASVGLYVGGAGGFNQSRIGSVGPLVRTSVPPRAAAVGRLVSDVATTLAVVAPPAIALGLLVTVGAVTPVVPAVLGIAALPVVLAALSVGRAAGTVARYVNERLAVSLWVKASVVVVVSVVAFVGSQLLIRSWFDSGTAGPASMPVAGAVGGTALVPGRPLQAYALATLSPLGSTPSAWGGLVVLVVLGTAPVALTVALRTERVLLERDVGRDDAETTTGSRGVPRPFTATPSTRVAWRYLLRTRRDPRTLAHLGPFVFGALGLVGTGVTDPDSLLLVGPGTAAVGGAAVVGAAYCLNPLGDDREQLPLLLTSVRSPAVLLRGRAIAGGVLGLVVAIGVGAPLGWVGFDPAYALGQSAFAVAFAAASAGTALGIGSLLPQFERREYMSVERAHPSTVATLGFFFGSIVVGGTGLVLMGVIRNGPGPAAVVAAAVYLAVVGASGVGGYVYAVRRARALTLEDV